ncbi:DUF1127 domain-containing protein [Bradyrhizobium sp. 41S5]|uniref:DUF1127 domain-containing protein n=1 Tax=Bradyrhizobium sp. 41S5 TaxID=1404443 RepID=UPI001E3F0AD8|nr:DUF1127 domain-containing protein [Bradyrhizobium sp. 41S5]UFX43690.1 DUF1127 domain-containing protein [Bradyrhizobium sp. 41S5]
MPAAFAAALFWFRQWREDRRSWRQLAAMSERDLQDIGVCRADICHRRRDDEGRPYWPP